MNYSYKKKYNKNYLVLDQFDSPIASENYKIEMLKRNTIEGLLSMELFIEDNIPSFYYDITCKQSFYSFFYDCKITKKDIIRFFTDLHNTLLNLNKYLLDYDHLVLIPQCIFFNKDNASFSFCYCPNHKSDFFSSLKDFIAYILTITDHDDEKTVLISYGLWQETQNEDFNLKSLLSIIEKNSFSETSDVPQTISEPPLEITENTENNILKEPDVLLKENYTYESIFLIKNIVILSSAGIVLIANIILKLMSFYSTELFFIILITVLVFCIFYSSNIIREAPIHRVYDKQEEPVQRDIIRINTNINFPDTSADNTCDNNETVLLSINPMIQTRQLIYTGLDFSQEAKIDCYPFTIGKKDESNLVINSPAVSRSHARIVKENDKYYIEDLNSSNGTKVNDVAIASYTLTEITIGDTITFADLTYIFQ